MNDKMRPAAQVFKKRYSQSLLQAIDWAMEVDPMYRPQSVDELLEALAKDVPEVDDPVPEGGLLSRLANNLPWKKD